MKSELNMWTNILPVLVVIFSSFAVLFSGFSTSCGDKVDSMLFNKTQLFQEKQYLLFERTWSIDARNAFKAAGLKDLEEAYQNMVPGPYKEYQDFLREMKEYDNIILEKKKVCGWWNIGSNVLIILVIFLSLIQSFLLIKKK